LPHLLTPWLVNPQRLRGRATPGSSPVLFFFFPWSRQKDVFKDFPFQHGDRGRNRGRPAAMAFLRDAGATDHVQAAACGRFEPAIPAFSRRCQKTFTAKLRCAHVGVGRRLLASRTFARSLACGRRHWIRITQNGGSRRRCSARQISLSQAGIPSTAGAIGSFAGTDPFAKRRG